MNNRLNLKTAAHQSGAMETLKNNSINYWKNLAKKIVPIVLAGSIALNACNTANDDSEPTPTPPNPNPPSGIVEDKSSNQTARDKIYNYITRVCITHGHETEQEVMDCVISYADRVLYMNNKDTTSKKLAYIYTSAGKVGNPKTFDYSSASVEVTTGNGTGREGSKKILTPYNPQARAFTYDYEIKNTGK